jgi:CHRD domain-containing protein
MLKVFRSLLSAILLSVFALAVVDSPAVASSQAVKLTLSLDAVNPVTGTATGDPDATGTAVFKFHPESGEVCYKIKVRGLEAPTEPAPGIGDAHIHAVSTGAIVVDLDADFHQADGYYIATDCVTTSPEVVAAILANPTAYYINIHNAPYPGGALFAVL